ncbi:MAG: hypothetical protein DIU84_09375 [Bacillota bacterium]|nr:MAG: hypothetical protein DIU84_09375 [Bacillota bacterium]
MAAMTERTGTYTTPDGTAVHYEEHGEGLPVYVCHGGPTLSYTYMRQALEPLARRCTLVYHDYRGCGRSGRAAPETYRFEQLAADLDGLRAFLGHQRIVLLAHSMGGFVALHYALQFPQHVERLILVATTPSGSPGRLVVPTLGALGFTRLVRTLAQLLGFGLWWAWRPDSPQRSSAWDRIMARLQEGRRDRVALVRAAEAAASVQSDNAARLEAEMYRTDLTPRLPEVRCPVLVLCGERDAVFFAALRFYRSGLPQARFVTFPDVGHYPALEEPEAFTRELVQFLDGVPERRQGGER